MAKNTYGTGCFMLMHTGDASGRVDATACSRPVACAARRHAREYALEGSVFIAGAVVQWLRDGLRAHSQPRAEVEALAASVPDNGGVYLVPAFAGLGAPHWDPYARGAIVGLTRGTTRGAHRARRARERSRFQSADVLRGDADATPAMHARPSCASTAAPRANDLLMQFQADLLGVPVVRPKVLETTALGAAYLAGLARRLLARPTSSRPMAGRAALRADDVARRRPDELRRRLGQRRSRARRPGAAPT